MRYMRVSTASRKISSSIDVDIQFDKSVRTESFDDMIQDDGIGSKKSKELRSAKQPFIQIEESINPFSDPLWERFLEPSLKNQDLLSLKKIYNSKTNEASMIEQQQADSYSKIKLQAQKHN
ncbi:UNKNOWN [Stylonychia lemnae]|uniref:Uncharacterized protein n=1 Tax=Stylonychia lemnae TaxID=5949 RepID=A0A077ZR96_STYLE|nr:UNKNOWN [Stylonychia lemnae]|eukprot:CDW71974.1 UNKNOWN [Stylonychia lemnae]